MRRFLIERAAYVPVIVGSWWLSTRVVDFLWRCWEKAKAEDLRIQQLLRETALHSAAIGPKVKSVEDAVAGQDQAVKDFRIAAVEALDALADLKAVLAMRQHPVFDEAVLHRVTGRRAGANGVPTYAPWPREPRDGEAAPPEEPLAP